MAGCQKTLPEKTRWFTKVHQTKQNTIEILEQKKLAVGILSLVLAVSIISNSEKVVNLPQSLLALVSVPLSDVEQGMLYHRVPGFCNYNIATIHSAKSGNWSSADTWKERRVPTTNDKVYIGGSNAVVYDVSSTAEVECVQIDVGGNMVFSREKSTELHVTTLLVKGTLDMGTDASPIPANVTARVVYNDVAINTAIDPGSIGNGLLVLGTFTSHGAIKSLTFVRVAGEHKAGETVIRLESPVSGWKAGDVVVLAGSSEGSQVNNQYAAKFIAEAGWDEVTISSISPDGKSITLTKPLAHNHPCARNADDAITFCPHAMNTSRNVSFTSENAIGTRGHTIFMHRASTAVKYTEFSLMGRTTNGVQIDQTTYDKNGVPIYIASNHTGRYALHYHHVIGPAGTPADGYQGLVVGNSINRSRRWGFVIHRTSDILAQGNTIYRAEGAGASTGEDGPETRNKFLSNMVLGVTGSKGIENIPEVPEDFEKSERADRQGSDGIGIWSRAAGTGTEIRGNVIANVMEDCISIGGYKAVSGPATAKPGDDFHIKSQSINTDRTKPFEFVDNEFYDCANGIFIPSERLGGPHIVKDSRFWHNRLAAIYVSGDLLAENVKIYGDKERGSTYVVGRRGIGYYDKGNLLDNVILRNVTIEGMNTGFLAAGRSSKVINSTLRNYKNINAGGKVALRRTEPIEGDGDITVEIINSTFKMLPALPAKPNLLIVPSNIVAGINIVTPDKTTGLIRGLDMQKQLARYDVHIENSTLEGVHNQTFNVWANEQKPEVVIPGLVLGGKSYTNAEAKAAFNSSMGDGIAPCNITKPGIVGGVVCPQRNNSNTIALIPGFPTKAVDPFAAKPGVFTPVYVLSDPDKSPITNPQQKIIYPQAFDIKLGLNALQLTINGIKRTFFITGVATAATQPTPTPPKLVTPTPTIPPVTPTSTPKQVIQDGVVKIKSMSFAPDTSTVTITYTMSGTFADHVNYKFDNGAIQSDLDKDGTITITNLTSANHVITLSLTRTDNTLFTNSGATATMGFTFVR